MSALRLDRLAVQRANGLLTAAARQHAAAPQSARLLAAPTTTPLVPRCRTSPRPLRSFTTTSHLSKKSKAKKMAEQDAHNPGSHTPSPSASSDSKHPEPSPLDPGNLDDLVSRWTAAESHFRDALKAITTGGRFNPDALGALPVAPSPKSPERFPLRELAQVVPRSGRTVSLLAHEKENIKPIMAAIQASPDFNQQPQPGPDNELELILKVEPERKEDLIARVKSLTLQWRDRVRAASEKRKKLVAKWHMQKEIGPDMRKRIEADMQKRQNEAMKVVDQLEKQTLQRL